MVLYAKASSRIGTWKHQLVSNLEAHISVNYYFVLYSYTMNGAKKANVLYVNVLMFYRALVFTLVAVLVSSGCSNALIAVLYSICKTHISYL